MDWFEQEGASLLAPLREVQPGVRSEIDVTRAMKTGKRRQRKRLVAGLVAVAAVAAMSVVAVPSLVGAMNTVPPAELNMDSDPTLFGMRAFPLQVGTAGGYAPLMFSVMRIKAVVSMARTDGRPGSAEVGMYPSTRYQPAPDQSPGYSQAEPINGHRVFWVMGEDRPTLAMEYGNKKWVRVTANDTEPDLQSRVRHIAESITLAPTPVRVPFTVTPKDADGVTPTLLEIQNVPSGKNDDTTVVKLSWQSEEHGPQVTLTVTHSAATGANNDTINGHTAIVSEGEVILRDVDGFSVKVHRDTPGEDFSMDRLKALAGTIELVPGAQDRDNWTDTPLR